MKMPLASMVCRLVVGAAALCASCAQGGSGSQPPEAVVVSFAATAGERTAPFIVEEGAVYQPARTTLKDGGRLSFPFRVDRDGEYLVKAVVEATSDETNSFFVAIDEEPRDPIMIWDISKGPGWVEHAVSWRGGGDLRRSEFSPKIFRLAAGAHTLLFVGREAARLKTVTIVRLARP